MARGRLLVGGLGLETPRVLVGLLQTAHHSRVNYDDYWRSPGKGREESLNRRPLCVGLCGPVRY